MTLFAYRVSIAAAVFLLALLTACSGQDESLVSQTPRPSTATQTVPPTPTLTPLVTSTTTPSPSPAPTIAPGSDAWVSASVATLWRSQDVVRAVDQPALGMPPRVREWLTMSDAERADLEGRADSQLLLGDRVQVLAISGDWAQVAVPEQSTPLDSRGYPGWIPLRQLSPIAPYATGQVATVISPTASLRTPDGLQMLEVSLGTRLPATIEGGDVHVSLPGGGVLIASASDVAVAAPDAPALAPTAESVLQTAQLFSGLPYLWAGTSGFGFDCSGFVYQVYKAHGITLPRDAEPQSTAGVAVSREAMQPGDLVFFLVGGWVGHVGIYTGDGMMIHAPNTGDTIKASSIDSEPFASSYAGARRVLP
jgi:cell wall-associated NlpC family hydrolase